MTEKLSPETEAEISRNLTEIRERIEKAKTECGIEKPITLLAATKTVPAEIINYATQSCGLTDIGENRVQELLDKYDQLDKKNVTIHFIGTLQPNKVKYIIDKVDLIHSVDSLRLAKEIDKQAAKIGKVMDVLIEVNIGREENKSGVMPEDTEALCDEILLLQHVRLCGMMVIGPVLQENSDYQKIFSESYRIFLDISEKKLHNISRRVLSMGMSGNYDCAIRCGSDLVRIGTAIFGKRSYPV